MRRVHQILGVWTGLVLIFLYAPIALLVIYSFNRSRLNVAWRGFTLEWYRELVHNAPLMRALINSLIIASFTTLLSVALGTGGAWLMYRHRFPFQRTLATLIFVPLVIPEVIMGISLLIFFALFSAWGNQALRAIAIESEPLGLGFATVIISHVTFCFPFVL